MFDRCGFFLRSRMFDRCRVVFEIGGCLSGVGFFFFLRDVA